MKHVFRIVVCVSALSITCSVLLPLTAQTVKVSNRPAKNASVAAKDNQGRDVLLRGETVNVLRGGLIEFGGLRIDLLGDEFVTNTVRAPHALLDQNERIVFSTNELSLGSSDHRLALEGRGYRFAYADTHLSLSNDVRTAIRKRAVATASSIPVSPEATNDSAGSDLIRIWSDQLDYRREVAVFTGHVRATEAESRFSSGKLTVHFTLGSTNHLDRIIADHDVLIEQGTMQARADQAIYNAEHEKGILELKGNTTWRDGLREGSAETLTLDRTRNLLRAEGRSRVKMPRASLASSGSLLPKAGAAAIRSLSTNDFVEISSELLLATLPSTNGPIRRIEAVRNVVIAFTAEQARATGDRAVYDEAAGTVELTGQPQVQGEGRIVRGDRLVFDRARNAFIALGNAYVKLPVAALGKSPLFDGSAGAANAAAMTNQFIEVFCDHLDYRTNALTFRGNVRAHWLENDVKRGQFHSAELQLDLGERLESLAASGGVQGWVFPVTGTDGQTKSGEFRAESLFVTMSARGQPETVQAKGAVWAERTILRPGNPLPTKASFSSEVVNAKFFSHTNQLERLVAERNVRMAQDGRSARGEHAVFDGKTQIFELTGQPTATFPEGSITNAAALLLNATNQRVSIKGKFESNWQRPTDTNSVRKLNAPGRVGP